MNENKNVMMEETVEEVTNAIVVQGSRDELFTGVTTADLINPQATDLYCSIKNDGTTKSKGMIYNAINSPDKKVADFINTIINLKDVVAHPVTLTDEETGEIIQTLRVILVDDKGVTYEAVSGGIANSLQRLIAIYGQPATWTESIKVKPIQKATRNGNNKVTTLEVVL